MRSKVIHHLIDAANGFYFKDLIVAFLGKHIDLDEFKYMCKLKENSYLYGIAVQCGEIIE